MRRCVARSRSSSRTRSSTRRRPARAGTGPTAIRAGRRRPRRPFADPTPVSWRGDWPVRAARATGPSRAPAAAGSPPRRRRGTPGTLPACREPPRPAQRPARHRPSTRARPRRFRAARVAEPVTTSRSAQAEARAAIARTWAGELRGGAPAGGVKGDETVMPARRPVRRETPSRPPRPTGRRGRPGSAA